MSTRVPRSPSKRGPHPAHRSRRLRGGLLALLLLVATAAAAPPLPAHDAESANLGTIVAALETRLDALGTLPSPAKAEKNVGGNLIPRPNRHSSPRTTRS